MLYNIIGTCFAIIVPSFWYSYQYISILADAIANFFLLVVTDVIVTVAVKNHEDIIMADVFLPMWLIMAIL